MRVAKPAGVKRNVKHRTVAVEAPKEPENPWPKRWADRLASFRESVGSISDNEAHHLQTCLLIYRAAKEYDYPAFTPFESLVTELIEESTDCLYGYSVLSKSKVIGDAVDNYKFFCEGQERLLLNLVKRGPEELERLTKIVDDARYGKSK